VYEIIETSKINAAANRAKEITKSFLSRLIVR